MAGHGLAFVKGMVCAGWMVCAVMCQAQGGAAPSPPNADRQLVETACTACHDIGQVQAHTMSAADWAVTVDRMIGLGAQISDEDRLRIITYLAAHQGLQKP